MKPRLIQLFRFERIDDLCPWDRPVIRLPVDDEVQRLIDRIDDKGAKIRLRFDQARACRVLSFMDLDFPIEMDEGSPRPRCPFFATRYYLLRAVVTADFASSGIESSVAKLDEMQSAGTDLLNQCRNFEKYLFSEDFSCKPFNSDEAIFESNDYLRRREAWKGHFESIVHALPQVETAIGKWLSMAAQERDRLSRPLYSRDPWRETFVEVLGYCWKLLTSADPARHGPFHDFVTAAHQSVGGDAPMDRSIRNVLKKVASRPVEDRWSREFLDRGEDADGWSPFVTFSKGKQEIWRGAEAWAPPPDVDNVDEYDDDAHD
ncbi:hypothetical protein [Bradyrhizobium sp. SZCCHNR2028]|uniref:hypothetical protein n=1 Tax=Bradyrhizobium sp. SZCCHNR2028 TaxID=3057382 RepID=UPI0028ED0EC3|nr:hypothetical protein [Bradyrhizobium sp. SZCCHNR2028]